MGKYNDIDLKKWKDYDNIETDSLWLIDKRSIDYAQNGISSVQFILFHPPYWDIIKFSDNPADLSNAQTIEDFLRMFGEVIGNACEVLDKGRHFAIVIGDKYANSEIVPLGFYCMHQIRDMGYIHKATIIKNFGETKGKANRSGIWRYRALASDFYIFKHEYIFAFKKTK